MLVEPLHEEQNIEHKRDIQIETRAKRYMKGNVLRILNTTLSEVYEMIYSWMIKIKNLQWFCLVYLVICKLN